MSGIGIKTGSELGKALMKIFKIEHLRVTNICINAAAQEIATVEIKTVVTSEDMKKIEYELSKYELTRVNK